ncbi:hypothetical protein SAMN04515620_11315 [Collimonas sp. OK607]|nr:hypothetical protein SAMN04515620_11315 [Collimonas sp. OK607]
MSAGIFYLSRVPRRRPPNDAVVAAHVHFSSDLARRRRNRMPLKFSFTCIVAHSSCTICAWRNFMKIKHCSACGQVFQPRPQVPLQCYCENKDCQRERRRRWQLLKRQSDPDYQDNQARAQQAWNQRNPGYWREYRITHPEYAERNRALQRGRNASTPSDPIAKMDASTPEMPLPSGIYRLSMVTTGAIAKMDVWTVEITAHACQCVPDVKIAKRGRVR